MDRDVPRKPILLVIHPSAELPRELADNTAEKIAMTEHDEGPCIKSAIHINTKLYTYISHVISTHY